MGGILSEAFTASCRLEEFDGSIKRLAVTIPSVKVSSCKRCERPFPPHPSVSGNGYLKTQDAFTMIVNIHLRVWWWTALAFSAQTIFGDEGWVEEGVKGKNLNGYRIRILI